MIEGRLEVLNPTAEVAAGKEGLSPRLESLSGITIGVLWNGRWVGEAVLRRVVDILREEYGVGELVFRSKPYIGNIAPTEIFEALNGCDAVLTGVGD